MRFADRGAVSSDTVVCFIPMNRVISVVTDRPAARKCRCWRQDLIRTAQFLALPFQLDQTLPLIRGQARQGTYIHLSPLYPRPPEIQRHPTLCHNSRDLHSLRPTLARVLQHRADTRFRSSPGCRSRSCHDAIHLYHGGLGVFSFLGGGLL
jgi:hypothetical protein